MIIKITIYTHRPRTFARSHRRASRHSNLTHPFQNRPICVYLLKGTPFREAKTKYQYGTLLYIRELKKWWKKTQNTLSVALPLIYNYNITYWILDWTLNKINGKTFWVRVDPDRSPACDEIAAPLRCLKLSKEPLEQRTTQDWSPPSSAKRKAWIFCEFPGEKNPQPYLKKVDVFIMGSMPTKAPARGLRKE